MEIELLLYVYIKIFYNLKTLYWAHCKSMGSVLQSPCEAYDTGGTVLV